MQAAKHDRRAGRSGRRFGAAAAAALLAASATGLVSACHASKPDIPVFPVASRASGQVIELDASASRVVFLDAGKRHAVSYGPETIVKKGADDLAPGDIRPGDRIVVSVDPDAVDRARVIAVAGGPRGLPPNQARAAPVPAPALFGNPAATRNPQAFQTPWNR